VSLTIVRRGWWYQAHARQGGRKIQICPTCSEAIHPRLHDTEVCVWCLLEVHAACATDYYPPDTRWPQAGPAKRCTECPVEAIE
jgi:hypothetical protein